MSWLLGIWIVMCILFLVFHLYDGFMMVLGIGLCILFLINPKLFLSVLVFPLRLIPTFFFSCTEKGKEMNKEFEKREHVEWMRKEGWCVCDGNRKPLTSNELLSSFNLAVYLGYGTECIDPKKTPATLEEAKDLAIKLFLDKWPSFQELEECNLTFETICAFLFSKAKDEENRYQSVRFFGCKYIGTGYTKEDYPNIQDWLLSCSFPKNIEFSPKWTLSDQDIWNGHNNEARAELIYRKERELYHVDEREEDYEDNTFHQYLIRSGNEAYKQLQAKRAAFAAGYRHPLDETNLIRRFIAADTTEFPDWDKYCQIKSFLEE